MMTLLDALKNYLRENGYRSGEKIPTEMELAAHFNVSRSRIREATTTLCRREFSIKRRVAEL